MTAPASVLVVRLSALGDVVTTLPAFHRLRRAWPNTRFAWAIEAAFTPVLDGLPGVERVVVLRTRRWRRRPFAAETRREIAGFASALREVNPDLAIDFQGTLKSATVARLSGARQRWTLGRGELREPAAAWLANRRGRGASEPPRHAVDRSWVLAGDLLGETDSTAPTTVTAAHVPDDPQGRIAEFVATIDRPFALLQPAAGWRNKEWGAERFAELALELYQRRGLRAVVAWGPGEEALASDVTRRATGVAVLAPATSIRELAALALHAAIVVGGDTGPIHLAAAAGAPTLALLGPTGRQRHAPHGPRATAIEVELPCRPCDRRFGSRKPCLERLAASKVADAVLACLRDWNSES